VSETPVKLTVTDWLWAGDLFEVYSNGTPLGRGSDIPVSSIYAGTPDLASHNNAFSRASWILAPGSHSIAIMSLMAAPTWDDATVAFKAEAIAVPVPEPGTTALMLGIALAGLAGFRRLTAGTGAWLACS
jgi:hypothetical protein